MWLKLFKKRGLICYKDKKEREKKTSEGQAKAELSGKEDCSNYWRNSPIMWNPSEEWGDSDEISIQQELSQGSNSQCSKILGYFTTENFNS